MKKFSLFIALVVLLVLAEFALRRQPIPAKLPAVTIKHVVSVHPERTHYRQGEPVIFTIDNNSGQTITFYPETCASKLARIFAVQNNISAEIEGDPKVCAMVSTPRTLQPGKSLSAQIPAIIISRMPPGTYKIRFTFTSQVTAWTDSDVFTVGK